MGLRTLTVVRCNGCLGSMVVVQSLLSTIQSIQNMIQVERLRRVFDDAHKLNPNPFVRGQNYVISVRHCHCAMSWILRSVGVSSQDIEECSITTLIERHAKALYANFGITYADAKLLVSAFDSGGINRFWRVVTALNDEGTAMK